VKNGGFSFEERPRSCLPTGFVAADDETCHFLLDFRHPQVSAEAPLADHVGRAMQDVDQK
jgi:hypothetical protein